jgi:uncharacterized protein (UPF0548 family)
MACFWSLRIPDQNRLEAFLASQTQCNFSYPHVGATADCLAPAGFDHDHNRILLGRGEQVFQAACAALRQWQQFPQSWTRIFPAHAPLEVGTTVAVLIRVFNVWRLNSARIVYVVDESKPLRRFGFAYGTLPAHVECGEEQFAIECDTQGNVWYDLRAFSRPQSWLTRLGYPLVRRLQRRFVRHSQQALQAAIKP